MKNKEVYEQVRSKSESEIREKWQNFEVSQAVSLVKPKFCLAYFLEYNITATTYCHAWQYVVLCLSIKM